MSPRTRVLVICSEIERSTHTWAHGTPSPSTLPRVCLLGATTPVLFAHMHDARFTSCCLRVFILCTVLITRAALSLAGGLCPPWTPSQTSESVSEPRPDFITGSLVGWLPLDLLVDLGTVLLRDFTVIMRLIMRMVTFGQPLQGVHLIDKPCPRLWTTLNIWLDHRTTYTFYLLLITCVVICFTTINI